MIASQPPTGTEPAHWLIWTLEPAATAHEAREVVRKYTCRWPIEEVYLTLKSGCQVEALPLATWDGLEKAMTVNAAVAARIVSLRDLARETPEAPARHVLIEDEIEVLVLRFRERDQALGADDRPGSVMDRPPGRPSEPQVRRNARREDVVAWAS